MMKYKEDRNISGSDIPKYLVAGVLCLALVAWMSNASKTQIGAVTGAVVGALAGSAMTGNVGGTVAGMAIGGAAGYEIGRNAK